MTFIKRCIKSSIVIVLLTIGSMSMANTAQMHTTLARINHLLAQIYPLINLAQQQQDPHERVLIKFDALRHDIARIQTGIAHIINRPSIQPREVIPLTGDYLPGSRVNVTHKTLRTTQDTKP